MVYIGVPMFLISTHILTVKHRQCDEDGLKCRDTKRCKLYSCYSTVAGLLKSNDDTATAKNATRLCILVDVSETKRQDALRRKRPDGSLRSCTRLCMVTDLSKALRVRVRGLIIPLGLYTHASIQFISLILHSPYALHQIVQLVPPQLLSIGHR